MSDAHVFDRIVAEAPPEEVRNLAVQGCEEILTVWVPRNALAALALHRVGATVGTC
jgi:hypothetical protein